MRHKSQPHRTTLKECEDGQLYGRVTKLLGNYRVMVYCNDDQERMGIIRGSMRKKVWIAVGDIVLVSLRECVSSDDKADICDRFDSKEVYQLRKSDPSINPKLFMDHESKMLKGESIHEKEESNGFEFGLVEEEKKEESFDFDAI
jgi:initiation factor 1A